MSPEEEKQKEELLARTKAYQAAIRTHLDTTVHKVTDNGKTIAIAGVAGIVGVFALAKLLSSGSKKRKRKKKIITNERVIYLQPERVALPHFEEEEFEELQDEIAGAPSDLKIKKKKKKKSKKKENDDLPEELQTGITTLAVALAENLINEIAGNLTDEVVIEEED